MPEISRFYGIIVSMYYDDHNPPHFHVRYSGQKAAIRIPDLTLLEGGLTPRVLGMTIEWAAKHQEDLLENWEKLRNNIKPSKIEPLF